MATRTETLWIDDLDGSSGDGIGTVQFGLDGQPYEIDLKPKHAADLRDRLAKYIAAARKTSASRPSNGRARPTGRRRAAGQLDAIDALGVAHRAQVRAWAKANPAVVKAAGLPPVSDRGRLSRELVALYDREARS